MARAYSSYLTPKCEGRRVARGFHAVFAVQPIAAGELLVVWGGSALTGSQLAQLPPRRRRLSIQVDDDIYLVPTQPGPGDWVNHACEPNAGMSSSQSLIAMRDILPGEQVCFDYAMTDGSPYDEFECLCGTPGCRHRVTGQDWQIPELQRRYEGYFSPYLQRRMQSLGAYTFIPKIGLQAAD